jgi:hypothetical protein
MKKLIPVLGVISFLLLGCGKDESEQPSPNLSMALVVDNAEGVGAVLNAKDREAELARAEMIVRFSK